MNENVKTKTPKRRRWIARLLVSALCILLASSLLFIGVFAETITLSAQFSSSWSYSGLNGVFYHSNSIVLPEGVLVSYIGSSTNSDLALCIAKSGQSADYYYVRDCIGYDSAKSSKSYACVGFDSATGDFYLVGQSSYDNRLTLAIYHFDFNNGSFVASSVRYFTLTSPSVAEGYQGNHCPFFVSNGAIYGFATIWDGNGYVYIPFELSYLGFSFYPSSKSSSLPAPSYLLPTPVYFDGVLVWGGQNLYFDFNSAELGRLSFSSYSNPSYNVFSYNGSVYCINSAFIGVVDFSDLSVSLLGNGVSGSFVFVDGSILYSCSFDRNIDASQYSIPYTVYSGLPTAEPPTESSDETTETPPESSDETSDPGDIPEGYTKIWYSTLASDGSYSATVIGTIDLREAVEVRAYLGSWTSIDASFQSDIQVPLTIQVFNSEEGPPVVYTYDYYAAGYAVDSGIPDDFVFPDFIGDYVTLPYNGELNIYFADVSPSGTVLVSTPATWGGRVTLNLTSASSYFRLDFIDEDTFAVVVFNGDGPGSRVNFNFDIRAYREYYVASDGDKTTSRWFTPSFGTFVSYSSERVLNDGLYMVFVDSYNDTDYPWEDGDWSSAIDDMNSRLDEISYDHALLESLANDAYGDFPFGSADKADFDAAISNFDTIKDSSGGDYILRYISGLWTIHPFASSMVIIVGTFAIIGFIIRKL